MLHLPVLQVDSRGVLRKMKVPPWSIFQAILLSTFTALEFEVLINLRKKCLPKKLSEMVTLVAFANLFSAQK